MGGMDVDTGPGIVESAEAEQAPVSNQALAADALQAVGFNDYQTAAFLGHMQHESQFQPGIKQIGAENNPSAGRGWGQYTGPRRQQYEAFMAQHPAPYTPVAEADYLQTELSAPAWKNYVNKIKATPDLPSASAAVMQYWGLGDVQSRNPQQSMDRYPLQWATLPGRIADAQSYLAAPSYARGGRVAALETRAYDARLLWPYVVPRRMF